MTILTIIHIIVCLFLVVIVLLQQGKGANMGATFGGSSQTVFGSEGPQPLLGKVTTIAAITFMVTSLTLAYISSHRGSSSVMKDFQVQKPQENAIERSSEPLPQSGSPDMPLKPAESAVPPPVADVVEKTAPAQNEGAKKSETTAMPAVQKPAEQEKGEAVVSPAAEEKPVAQTENKEEHKEKK